MPVYKNEFAAPNYTEETIVNTNTRELIGKVRIKPSGILWKPKSQQKYYAVTLDQFDGWITNPATAARRKSR
jgi:hypothetical protein